MQEEFLQEMEVKVNLKEKVCQKLCKPNGLTLKGDYHHFPYAWMFGSVIKVFRHRLKCSSVSPEGMNSKALDFILTLIYSVIVLWLWLSRGS